MFKTPLLVTLLLSVPIWAQQLTPQPVTGVTSVEINTALMESTFFVSGPSARPGEENLARFGAAFVLLRQAKEDSDSLQYVLVTAKHVFDDIKGDTATLTLRRRNASGNVEIFPWPLQIRTNGKNVYVGHPSADVAAIDVALPNDSIVVQLGSGITNIKWLATDEFLGNLKLHPGDELLCLGFPLGIQPNGYPVLRSGRIASYPILPTKKIGGVVYDFRVFPGNSGGPVYLAYLNREYKGITNLGTTYQKVFGLVSQQAAPIQNADPSLGVIVPAVFIKETIDLVAGFEAKIKEDF